MDKELAKQLNLTSIDANKFGFKIEIFDEEDEDAIKDTITEFQIARILHKSKNVIDMYDIKITHDKKKGWILLEKLDCDFDKLIS